MSLRLEIIMSGFIKIGIHVAELFRALHERQLGRLTKILFLGSRIGSVCVYARALVRA